MTPSVYQLYDFREGLVEFTRSVKQKVATKEGDSPVGLRYDCHIRFGRAIQYLEAGSNEPLTWPAAA